MTNKISSKKLPQLRYILYPIVFVIILAFDIYILVETLKMQKSNYQCKCAQVWFLKQVSNSIITIISLQLGIFVLSLIMNAISHHHHILSNVLRLLSVVLFIVQIYYIIMMVSLIAKLDTIKCVCVDPWFKSLMTYYAGIRVFLLLIVLMVFIILLVNKNK